MKFTYTVVIERKGTGYMAYAPDFPGLQAEGESVAEVTQLITHRIEAFITEASFAPPPDTLCAQVEISVMNPNHAEKIKELLFRELSRSEPAAEEESAGGAAG